MDGWWAPSTSTCVHPVRAVIASTIDRLRVLSTWTTEHARTSGVAALANHAEMYLAHARRIAVCVVAGVLGGLVAVAQSLVFVEVSGLWKEAAGFALLFVPVFLAPTAVAASTWVLDNSSSGHAGRIWMGSPRSRCRRGHRSHRASFLLGARDQPVAGALGLGALRAFAICVLVTAWYAAGSRGDDRFRNCKPHTHSLATRGKRVTDTPDEPWLPADQSPFGSLYRWLAFASTLVLVVSMFLGYLAVVTAPFGVLGAFVSLLIGMRWLDAQPRLRAVRPRDFVLLALAAAGTFIASLVVLQTPELYPVYWAGLGLLLLNACVFVRERRRGLSIGALVFVVFFVAAVFSARSRGIVRAVETGSAEHTRLFLWFGADPNLREHHDPLLLMALRAGDSNTVRMLLDHGADPNGQTSEFMARTPALSQAAGAGRTDLVELLLDRGAAPNLANNWGETALGRAARAGQAGALRLLLRRGANPNHADHNGRRPIDAAREANHSDVERILAP
jgi:hypothetical protein